MAYKVDDQRLHDPRMRDLRRMDVYDHAVALDFLAGIFCAERKSDGRLRRGAIHGFLRDSKKAPKAAAALVSVGLWREHPEDDEYELVGFLKRDKGFNESRAEYEARIEGSRVRMANSRSRRKDTVADDVAPQHKANVARDVTEDLQRPSSLSPLPSEEVGRAPDASPAPEPTKRKTNPVRKAPRPDGLERQVADLISTTRQSAGGVPFLVSTNSAKAVRELATWAEKSGLGIDGLERALVGFWRSHPKGTAAAIQWLAEDPGRWLGGAPRKTNDLAELEAVYRDLQREQDRTPDEDVEKINRLQAERARVWNEIRRRKDDAA